MEKDSQTGRQGRPSRRWKQRWKQRLINFYPPFLGAGIRVTRLDLPGRVIEARMKLTWWNRNYVGTHYGGSLYSICDPFHLVILIEHLGRDYIVWDKAAHIRFVRPGRGTVYVRVSVEEEEIEALRREADAEGTAERTLPVEVRDGEGRVVARVEKVVYVKRKRR